MRLLDLHKFVPAPLVPLYFGTCWCSAEGAALHPCLPVETAAIHLPVLGRHGVVMSVKSYTTSALLLRATQRPWLRGWQAMPRADVNNRVPLPHMVRRVQVPHRNLKGSLSPGLIFMGSPFQSSTTSSTSLSDSGAAGGVLPAPGR